MKKLLIVIAAVFMCVSFADAQGVNVVKKKYKRFSLDVYGGVPSFTGDTKNKFFGYAVTGRFNWNLTSAMSIGSEFTYGSMMGEDTDGSLAYFKTKYMRVLVGSEFYFFNAFKFNELTSWFQPFMGINAGMIKGTVSEAGLNGVDFAPDELYDEWAFISQFTMGAKFKVTKWLDINFRYGFNAISNDNFDNNNEDLIANQYYDHFSEANVGVTFHIGSKGKQPIIWKASTDKKMEEQEEEMDSIQKKMDELVEELEAEEEKVEALEDGNSELADRLGALEDMVAELHGTGASGIGIQDTFWGADEHIYVATLEGPVSATYYIVSGSYAIDANAAARVKELKELGYDPIIMDEIHADLNRVTIANTNSYEEALMQVAKYRKELDPSAWIIKKRKL